MASQIIAGSIVCSTIYSGADPKFRVTGLCERNPLVTSGFPSQRTSNAENVSNWWRHHEIYLHEHYNVRVLLYLTKLFQSRLRWGLLNQFPVFRYFPNNPLCKQHWLPIEYHVWIVYAAAQLRTRQFASGSKKLTGFYSKQTINGRSLSYSKNTEPYPGQRSFHRAPWRCQ